MNHSFVMISELHEFVDHVIVRLHRLDSLRNILRELSVSIIVQQEDEASAEFPVGKRLLEVVDVDLIAEGAVNYSLSEG